MPPPFLKRFSHLREDAKTKTATRTTPEAHTQLCDLGDLLALILCRSVADNWAEMIRGLQEMT